MNPRLLLLALAGLTAGAALAQHDHAGGEAVAEQVRPGGQPQAPRWTSQALIVPGRTGDRATVAMRTVGTTALTLDAFAAGAPDLHHTTFPITDAGAAVRPLAAGTGNYHWLQVREDGEEGVRVASTVWYFANPGPAPTRMLAMPKAELEIVPRPLPREHAQYREGERWHFAVRWRGQPLAGQAVMLETELGSRSTAFTDEAGVATVVFPRDFGAPGASGERPGQRPPRAGFVLSTAHSADGRSYRTAFNYSYAPESGRSRSPLWGAAFAVLGMAIAAPLLRRKELSHE